MGTGTFFPQLPSTLCYQNVVPPYHICSRTGELQTRPHQWHSAILLRGAKTGDRGILWIPQSTGGQSHNPETRSRCRGRYRGTDKCRRCEWGVFWRILRLRMVIVEFQSALFFFVGMQWFSRKGKVEGEISNYFWLSTCGYVLMRMLLSWLSVLYLTIPYRYVPYT